MVLFWAQARKRGESVEEFIDRRNEPWMLLPLDPRSERIIRWAQRGVWPLGAAWVLAAVSRQSWLMAPLTTVVGSTLLATGIFAVVHERAKRGPTWELKMNVRNPRPESIARTGGRAAWSPWASAGCSSA